MDLESNSSVGYIQSSVQMGKNRGKKKKGKYKREIKHRVVV